MVFDNVGRLKFLRNSSISIDIIVYKRLNCAKILVQCGAFMRKMIVKETKRIERKSDMVTSQFDFVRREVSFMLCVVRSR